MNYQRHLCSGHGSVPENNQQSFKFTASNSAQKAQFCKRTWNRQCRDGHGGDDLADFFPRTIKSWFTMATSRYDCARVNQYGFGIGTKSAISVHYAHCVTESSERLQKSAIETELVTANLKGCPIFMVTAPWPTHELFWYFTSLQTNILALLQIKICLHFIFSHVVSSGSK